MNDKTMKHHTTAAFRALLAAAPAGIEAKAQAAYKVWAQNPAHPSLRESSRHTSYLFSQNRPHDEYERLLSSL